MIKIDFSKAIPPRLGTYLLGIIPGLFFEASVAIGDPSFAASVVRRVKEIYPFAPYALLVLFVASALLIGQGFFLAAWIGDLLVAFSFAVSRYAIRITLGSRWLYRYFGKLPPKQNIRLHRLSRVIVWARGREFPSAARPVLKCLHIATRRLLKARYGIDRKFGGLDDGEWGVWYSVLGKPLKAFQEALMVSRTLWGCGLAGLTALYAWPVLRERYFIAMCVICTFAGCYASVNINLWRFDPVKRSTARLQSVLLELSEARTVTDTPKSDSVTIGADAVPD
jgi:hypothetical protein